MQDAAAPDWTRQEVAVVIPHIDDVARLRRCLDALARVPQWIAIDVVVVDNGSTADLGPVRSAHPGVRFLTEPRRGAAHARNAGVRATAAPLVFFLDADCVPDPDWLTSAMAAVDGRDIVGGIVRLFDETPPPRAGAEAFEAVFAFDQRRYVERHGFSVTANLLTRRSVLADVGPFTAGVPEDLDWCQRAARKGYRIAYAPTVAVSHPSRPDWPSLRRKWRRLTDEGFALAAYRRHGRLRWGLRALALPFSALLDLPRLLASPVLRGPRERAAGAATLVSLRVLRAAWMLRQAAPHRPGEDAAGRTIAARRRPAVAIRAPTAGADVSGRQS